MNELENVIKKAMSTRTRYIKKAEVLIFIEAACRQYGSQKNLAKNIGISPAYLNDVLNHRREPGKKILDWLGIERKVVYVTKDQDET